MMFRRQNVLLVVLLIAPALLSSTSKAASNFDCCLRYYESFKIHPSHFVGFTIQRADEVCDINAVIFHFKSGGDICVNPKQPWVKAAVKIVSKRVRNL